MLAQLILSKLIEPSWKPSQSAMISGSIMFQYFWKKKRGKPSGPSALSAPRPKVAFFISSLEKGSSNGERSTLDLYVRRVG